MKKLLSILLSLSILFLPLNLWATNNWGQTKPPLGSQIDWGNSLTQGLVGCWLLNESGGGRITNLVNNAPAIFPVAYWRPRGLYGKGTNKSYGLIKNTTQLDIETLTLALNYWNTASDTSNRVIEKWNTSLSPARYPYVVRWDNTAVRLKLFVYDGTNNPIVTGTISPRDNNNLQTVFTRSKGALLQCYENGNLTASVNDTTGTNNTKNGLDIGIFYRPTDTTTTVSGELRYLFIWNRVLSSSEIRQLYIDPYQIIKKPNWSLLKAAQQAGFIPTGKTLYNSVLYSSQL